MSKPLPRIIRRHEPASTITRDCDCACSDVVPVRTATSHFDSSASWQLSSSIQSYILPEDLRLVYLASGAGVTDGIGVLNNSAWEMLSAFQDSSWQQEFQTWQMEWGQEATRSILKEFSELCFIHNKNEKISTSLEKPFTLAAWLHITDRCNLRCKYCYFPHIRVDMSFETGRAAVEASFRSAAIHGYKQVKLKYAGGEPLIRFPFVVELHQYAQELAAKYALLLDGIILSNGTLLTPEIAHTMRRLKMRLMISLDGIDNHHNSHRVYADGHGSFNDVSRAVCTALAENIVPDISITVSSQNVQGLPELVDWIIAKDLPFSLNFYRENDYSKPHESLRLEEEKIVKGMKAVYEVIEANLPQRSLLASLVDRANLSTPHMRTCGVGHSYLVFNHLGQIAKCQMAINETVTNANEHDPLTKIRQDTRGILNLPVKQKEGCQDCEWQNWCTGGCSLATYRATGRYDVKSPNCNIYKALYPEVVRLEGLRLLKWYS
ncbi:MAG: radical SAM protein [Anaerolineaceae bacterium]|nr:radical SAM protein [Anaerolineaceae bacterium]